MRDSGQLRAKRIKKYASASGLVLESKERWRADGASSYAHRFAYDVLEYDECEELVKLGHVWGYRIRHDWTLDTRQIWAEADAVHADAVTYVDALIRELYVCDREFSSGDPLEESEHITILTHLHLAPDIKNRSRMWRDVAACLALMDAPAFFLVDPHALNEERHQPAKKLEARSNILALLKLGFVRMAGSRFLWGWNRRMSEMGGMALYSYSELIEAVRSGKHEAILGKSVAEDVYGTEISDTALHAMGLPTPESSMEDR